MFFESVFFKFVLLPFLIFLSRIVDVSLGTLRIILVSKGLRRLAPIIGFFEVLIWLIVINQIMQNVSNVATYFGYAAGFAAGTYFGMFIEKRLSIGNVVVRVITQKDAGLLFEKLKEEKFGVTVIDATGTQGYVKILFMIVKKQRLEEAIKLVEQYNPNAFFTIENVQEVKSAFSITHGLIPEEYKKNIRKISKTVRKGK
jgi:uncharacterized protein YebE (UPF0316 family)